MHTKIVSIFLTTISDWDRNRKLKHKKITQIGARDAHKNFENDCQFKNINENLSW